jgi:membrane-associated phospholipid phosphatase
MKRFNRLMAWISAAMILTVVVLLPVAQLHLAIFLVTLPAPFLIGIVAVWAQVVSFPRLRDSMLLCFWGLLITVCVGSLVWVAARTPFPLIDLKLAGIDHGLGFETSSAVRMMGIHPELAKMLGIIYALMIPFSLLALVVCVLEGKREPAQRLVLAFMVAAITTTTVFAFFPAAGPWTVYHFAAIPEQSLVQTTLPLLKASGPLHQSLQHCGLVAFPSFHVAQCILTALALWQSRWLRYPAAILAALMCVSTVTTGWHYVIDAIAGGGVAVFSQIAAGWIYRKWAAPIPATAKEF